MTQDLEILRQRLRETLLSGADTASLRAEIDRREVEQRRSEAQVARSNAERTATVDEAMLSEARARANASANRLKKLITRFDPEN
ncbi:hypothetical protein [Caballeronia sp. LZ032]|uniref:hypothetical protein n=1 Tax=Caballeronia sp. LZ032 TaxID=3038565 RepID=UPI002865567C|nr:hypothetical protein [Caballeronia sp. LZ032]MDR5878784.1 hypothetical protein [Caballeronia sp. LZ032]